MTPIETLESPPRSGHATVMTFIFHNPDGSERKRLIVTPKALLVAFVITVLGAAVMLNGPNELERMLHRQEAAELRPTMEQLASEGKEAASLWLVKNYFPENKQRMADLVASGNAEAMYVQGMIDKANGRVDVGDGLIAAAAEKGYAPAVQDLSRKD